MKVFETDALYIRTEWDYEFCECIIRLLAGHDLVIIDKDDAEIVNHMEDDGK